ncbi:probable 2-oxoglutarate/Fe(II)-dependent dioxygenase [Diospyros lotus]|uniref:probable 2-oxoglutarate/Fe(II)-dependent dioxygenase n=1 Tax=Diospyros lotus TaxID=55363 RepID=UPI002256DEFD|nr:probable 2-oxoglutarate/Fe(II)-dependent dioxygenase [Diospyros lotus]
MEIKADDCFHEAKFVDQNGHLRATRIPVVQELALRGVKDLPKRFIKDVPPCVRQHAEPKTLPSIDVGKLRTLPLESEARARELEKLAAAAAEWGMFVIENHGLESSVLDGVKDVVKGFFGLSFEEKRASVGTYMDPDNMGYGRNFVKSEEQPLDWVDRLTMKAAPAEASRGLRVWPENPPNFRKVMEKYVEDARKVCDCLLEAIAEALSLESRHSLLRSFDPVDSQIRVRINYYPPCPRPDLASGLAPHSDGNAVTLLMQFGAGGGLQVLRDGNWVAVPWPETALLVGVGDLLEVMTGGRLKSPWHRAAVQKDVERFSVALFYDPPPEAEIGPVDGSGGYKKVVAGEYLKNYYSVSPSLDKVAINFAKVG